MIFKSGEWIVTLGKIFTPVNENFPLFNIFYQIMQSHSTKHDDGMGNFRKMGQIFLVWIDRKKSYEWRVEITREGSWEILSPSFTCLPLQSSIHSRWQLAQNFTTKLWLLHLNSFKMWDLICIKSKFSLFHLSIKLKKYFRQNSIVK